MTAVLSELAVGSSGLTLTWSAPLGPALAHFEAWSRQVPAFTRHLSLRPSMDPAREMPPALVCAGDRIWTAWCDRRGAHAALLDPNSGEMRHHIVLDAGARACELVIRGGELLAFTGDDRGIWLHRLHAGDGRTKEDKSLCLARRQGGLEMHGEVLRRGVLLFYFHHGSRGFGVISVEDGVPARTVEHSTTRPVVSLDSTEAGGRAAFALGLQNGEVWTGVVGSGGRLVERPHPVFHRHSLRRPQTLWVEDGWVVAAFDEPRGRVLIAPVSESATNTGFELPRCSGPFSLAYARRRLFLLCIEVEREQARAELWVARPGGDQIQQRRVVLPLLDTPDLERQALCERTATGLVERIRRSSYRGATLHCRIDDGGRRVEVDDEFGRSEIEFQAGSGNVLIRVALCERVDIARKNGFWRRLFTPRRPSLAPEQRAEVESYAQTAGLRVVEASPAEIVLAFEGEGVTLEDLEPCLRDLRSWLRRSQH